MESLWMRLLNPALIWILIPITWIFLATIVEVLKLFQRHRERMAMIAQGMHPDMDEYAAHEESEGRLESGSGFVSRETADYEHAR